MTYPIAVLVVGIIVSVILLLKVVPQFESIFSSFGADLPVFTRMVLNLSDHVQKYWFMMLLAVIVAGYTFTYFNAGELQNTGIELGITVNIFNNLMLFIFVSPIIKHICVKLFKFKIIINHFRFRVMPKAHQFSEIRY